MLTARLNVLAMVVASVALFAGLSAAVEDRSADTCGHETVCSTNGQLSCQDYHPQCTIHNHYGQGSCCCCPSGAVPSPSPPAPASPSPASPPSPILPVPSPPPPVLSPPPPVLSPPSPVLSPPPPVSSPPPPSPAAAAAQVCATTTEFYVINFMGGRGAADTHCNQGICGGQDYACTNGTGVPRVSFTDRGNATAQTVVDLVATVQRASTAPAELVFYLNDREEGRIPPATGTTLACGSTQDQCTVQQLDVPNPGSYDVGGINNVRLDDDMGRVTCYPLLILRVTYQLNSCMNTTPPPPSPVTASASAAARV